MGNLTSITWKWFRFIKKTSTDCYHCFDDKLSKDKFTEKQLEFMEAKSGHVRNDFYNFSISRSSNSHLIITEKQAMLSCKNTLIFSLFRDINLNMAALSFWMNKLQVII